MQHMNHGDRVRFSGIRADVERCLGVHHVVVAIGHRTIAPGVGNASNRGRVANTRLVIGIVGTEERYPLAQQIRLLVIKLGRANKVQRVRGVLSAKIFHLGGNFIEGLIPGNALIFAIH